MSESGNRSPTALITNPHLKKVLKTYAQSAMNCLKGPGSFQDAWSSDGKPVNAQTTNNTSGGRAVMHSHPPDQHQHTVTPNSLLVPGPTKTLRKNSFSEQDFLPHPPPFPIQPAPLFSQPDQTSSERYDADFEDHKISCFVVGGEKRLCLPQLLNTVLTSRSLEEINAVCDELRIYISRCTSSQLDCLKASKILPTSAPSCGLITLTDAERLCGTLMHRKPDRGLHIGTREKSRQFPVVQRCFGNIQGTCFPDLFTNPEAACIECSAVQCRDTLFSPRHFVLHSHKSMEQGLCHWGFDSNNWRHYILIPQEEEIGQEAVKQCKQLLEEFKNKFDAMVTSAYVAAATAQISKRDVTKASVTDNDEQNHLPSKRIKIEEAVYPNGNMSYGPAGWYLPPAFVRGSGNAAFIASPNDMSSKFTQAMVSVNNVSIVGSAAAQIPSYLNRGPPLVINPERIVFASPFEKFDEKLQPNVALMPVSRPQSVIQRRPEGVVAFPVHSQAAVASGNFDNGSSAFSTSLDLQGTSRATVKGESGPRSESDDDSSSNSTLSIDFREESSILEEDEEGLNATLQFVDIEIRSQVVQAVKHVKQRYGDMLRAAQHDKSKIEKDLQYYKVSRKEKVHDLKVLLTASQHECAQVKLELTKKSTEVEHVRSDRAKLEADGAVKDSCMLACNAEKESLIKRLHEIEMSNKRLTDQLAASEKKSKLPASSPPSTVSQKPEG